MTRHTLDQQIVDVGGLVSLLLVFVFAYFSALLPTFEDLRHRARPNVAEDRETLRRQLAAYRALGGGLLVVVIAVLALLTPLSWRALNADLWNPFQTLRLGLLLVDALIVATGAGLVVEVVLVTKRRKELL